MIHYNAQHDPVTNRGNFRTMILAELFEYQTLSKIITKKYCLILLIVCVRSYQVRTYIHRLAQPPPSQGAEVIYICAYGNNERKQ
jgi:hypothetical protein